MGPFFQLCVAPMSRAHRRDRSPRLTVSFCLVVMEMAFGKTLAVTAFSLMQFGRPRCEKG